MAACWLQRSAASQFSAERPSPPTPPPLAQQAPTLPPPRPPAAPAPPRTAAPAVGATAADCAACGPGSYASGEGNSDCQACDAGTYQDQAGTEACLLCPDSSYAVHLPGAATCVLCSAGRPTACTQGSCSGTPSEGYASAAISSVGSLSSATCAAAGWGAGVAAWAPRPALLDTCAIDASTRLSMHVVVSGVALPPGDPPLAEASLQPGPSLLSRQGARRQMQVALSLALTPPACLPPYPSALPQDDCSVEVSILGQAACLPHRPRPPPPLRLLHLPHHHHQLPRRRERRPLPHHRRRGQRAQHDRLHRHDGPRARGRRRGHLHWRPDSDGRVRGGRRERGLPRRNAPHSAPAAPSPASPAAPGSTAPPRTPPPPSTAAAAPPAPSWAWTRPPAARTAAPAPSRRPGRRHARCARRVVRRLRQRHGLHALRHRRPGGRHDVRAGRRLRGGPGVQRRQRRVRGLRCRLGSPTAPAPAPPAPPAPPPTATPGALRRLRRRHLCSRGRHGGLPGLPRWLQARRE